MVVMGPVCYGTQAGSCGKYIRFGEQGHQGDKASIGAPVDPDALGTPSLLLHQVFDTIYLVAEVFTAHMAVDPGPPIPAITCAAPIVDVQYGISVIRQQVVEHIFAEVAAPPLVGILQIPGSMDEDDGRPGGARTGPPESRLFAHSPFL